MGPQGSDQAHSSLNLCRPTDVQSSEGFALFPWGEAIMVGLVGALRARCPLCGSPIFSLGQGGPLEAEDFHPIPLSRIGAAGEGYMLCEDCGVLAGLRADLSLN
jgi:hypothetical protein